MKTCYAYIRISHPSQLEGTSLDAQKEVLYDYAKRHSLKVCELIVEIDTASRPTRKKFNTLVHNLYQKKADGVIIYTVDRSARHMKDWGEINVLVDRGIDVYFVHQNLDLSLSKDRTAADFYAVFAVEYSRNLSREAKKGLYVVRTFWTV